MFSVLYENSSNLNAFQINQKTCVILTECIAAVSGLDVEIKWPNDILSATKKIGGVLVENIFKQGRLSHSIIGVGLNVNQVEFENLPKASSVKNLTGKIFEIKRFLQVFLSLFLNDQRDRDQIHEIYTSRMFGLNQKLSFQRGSEEFKATVVGTDAAGKLLLHENGSLKSYDLKEVSWNY